MLSIDNKRKRGNSYEKMKANKKDEIGKKRKSHKN